MTTHHTAGTASCATTAASADSAAPTAELDGREHLRIVCCELGMCEHPHAAERYRRTWGVAVRLADGDREVAAEAIGELYPRLERTFQNGPARHEANLRAFGLRALRHAVVDEFRARRRTWNVEDREVLPDELPEDAAGRGTVPDPADQARGNDPALDAACLDELTRLMFTAAGPRCPRHAGGCPHPEQVFSIAFGTVTAAGLADEYPPRTARRLVAAVAAPTSFPLDAAPQSAAARQAGKRLRDCSRHLLHQVHASVLGAA
ncbi:MULTISPECIES: hypothetical protein [Frankia]|uniref:Sigma factor n=1 Tax=Frankia alni (strain DSM 45986 / CECT 9034 / ACN14a) TaxID=326424 RepID=Q0RSE3_FRAAA|nr:MULTISPECIES: hypothetical protein [Frankia]CAJ59520.1 putative sigma factor [Frankia alni ACN14a]